MTTYRYAAYGSNLHPARLKRRVTSARLLGTGVVEGYSLRFNKRSFKDGSGKCTLAPADGSVHVAVFDIARSDKHRLDEYEGLGNGYCDAALEVPGLGRCQAYRAEASAIDDDLQPYDWYLAMVLLGCRLHRFPDDYIESVQRIEASEDPDVMRSRRQWALVQALHGNDEPVT